METLNDILEESARRFGGKDALMIRPGFRTRVWSYRDLNDITPRVARYLVESGVKQRDHGAVSADRRAPDLRDHLHHLLGGAAGKMPPLQDAPPPGPPLHDVHDLHGGAALVRQAEGQRRRGQGVRPAAGGQTHGVPWAPRVPPSRPGARSGVWAPHGRGGCQARATAGAPSNRGGRLSAANA